MNYGLRDGRIRCLRRGCSNLFHPHPRAPKVGPTKQKYCSTYCCNRAYVYRSGKQKPKVLGVCQAGHPRTPENTYKRSNGNIYCRECHAARQKERYYRKREEILARKRARLADPTWKEHVNRLNREWHYKHRYEISARLRMIRAA